MTPGGSPRASSFSLTALIVGQAMPALGTVVALMPAHPERANMGVEGERRLLLGMGRATRDDLPFPSLGRADTLTTRDDTKVSTGHGCAEDQRPNAS